MFNLLENDSKSVLTIFIFILIRTIILKYYFYDKKYFEEIILSFGKGPILVYFSYD